MKNRVTSWINIFSQKPKFVKFGRISAKNFWWAQLYLLVVVELSSSTFLHRYGMKGVLTANI